MQYTSQENRYGDDKVYDACGLIGVMDVTGERFSGHDIVKGIVNMTERGNGLGSGFAVYGCYPEHADCYAFHVMYTQPESRDQVESFIKEHFVLVHGEEVPHNMTPGLHDPPLIWRYFCQVEEKDPDQDPRGGAPGRSVVRCASHEPGRPPGAGQAIPLSKRVRRRRVDQRAIPAHRLAGEMGAIPGHLTGFADRLVPGEPDLGSEPQAPAACTATYSIHTSGPNAKVR